MNRRNFCKYSALAASGVTLFPSQSVRGKSLLQERLEKTLAIAMWDYSWILRHHRYGEFEDWDKVLEELAERGYNAIRIDVM
ncbi:MAG: cellulase-like family protein, partial [Mangrovibacterium sp.]